MYLTTKMKLKELTPCSNKDVPYTTSCVVHPIRVLDPLDVLLYEGRPPAVSVNHLLSGLGNILVSVGVLGRVSDERLRPQHSLPLPKRCPPPVPYGRMQR